MSVTTYVAQPWFNTRPEAMADGYREGDHLVLSEVSMAPEAESPEAAADVVFAALNADERPNGKRERSLSVGDVVAILTPAEHEGASSFATWLACDLIGWRSIDEPVERSTLGLAS